MNERELLERAAKAAGITILSWQREPEKCAERDSPFTREHGFWNPLTDDGDALRLAVKLGIDFYEGDDDGPAAYAGYYERNGSTRPQRFTVERHDAHPDPYAATRRAIVRAAAALAGDGSER